MLRDFIEISKVYVFDSLRVGYAGKSDVSCQHNIRWCQTLFGTCLYKVYALQQKM